MAVSELEKKEILKWVVSSSYKNMKIFTLQDRFVIWDSKAGVAYRVKIDRGVSYPYIKVNEMKKGTKSRVAFNKALRALKRR